MKTYIVRPYFGHDCDSEMGFNNGHHLPEITVSAASPEEAAEKAMQEFLADDVNEMVPDDAEIDGHCGENTVYWEFDRVWRRGNEETQTEPADSDDWECSYLYQYIDFNYIDAADEGGAK